MTMREKKVKTPKASAASKTSSIPRVATIRSMTSSWAVRIMIYDDSHTEQDFSIKANLY